MRHQFTGPTGPFGGRDKRPRNRRITAGPRKKKPVIAKTTTILTPEQKRRASLKARGIGKVRTLRTGN